MNPSALPTFIEDPDAADEVLTRARDPYRLPCAERGSGAKSVGYEFDGDDPFWRSHVRTEFTFRPTPGGWILVGDCPRCCHEFSEPLEKIHATARADRDSVRLLVDCDCKRDHKAAAGGAGCGRFGNFLVRLPSEERMTT